MRKTWQWLRKNKQDLAIFIGTFLAWIIWVIVIKNI